VQKIVCIGLSLCISIASAFVSLAGQWVDDDRGWKYQEYDGTFIKSKMSTNLKMVDYGGGITGFESEEIDYGDRTCYTIDGNGDGIAEVYYFDLDGYLLTDTIVKDALFREQKVDASGAQLDKNGKVITKTIPQGTIDLSIGKGIIKQEYINILLQNLETVDANLGTKAENRSYGNYLHITGYDEYGTQSTAAISLQDDKVVSLGGYAKYVLTDCNLTVNQITEGLGVKCDTEIKQGLPGYSYVFYYWTLQENPKVVLSMKDSTNKELRSVGIEIN